MSSDDYPKRPELRCIPGVRYTVEHAGRNEPCPCGSGKKYKRCCIRFAIRRLPMIPKKKDKPRVGP